MLRKVYIDDAALWIEKNPGEQAVLVNAFGNIDSIRRYIADNRIQVPNRAWIDRTYGITSIETRHPALGDRNPYSDSHNYGGLLSEYRGDAGQAGAVSRAHNKVVSRTRREVLFGGAIPPSGYDRANDGEEAQLEGILPV